MKAAARILSLCLAAGLATAAVGQKLPTGRYHANRERTYDLIHLRAELRFDFDRRSVHGRATLTIEPLAPLSAVALDAILLDVGSVTLDETPVEFSCAKKTLEIELGAEKQRGERFDLTVVYSATPRSGMYFQPDRGEDDLVFVTTYGEGGLHANWLPIYGDVNDKFSTEMVVTVPAPYVAVSNGKLVDERDDGGLRTFHWLQELPHSTYLISIYVGAFERGNLEPAFGDIPQSFWVPRGRLAEGAYAFRNSKRMVEFFSERFDYRYPWDKHDQIAIPDYAVGAMEHTGVTGHNASVLRGPDAPEDFGGPNFDDYHTDWTAEKTISHELAHHWFGDNLTCRNLSHLWLNESFASYLMMLWDEESLGRADLDLDVDLARRHYFEYVAGEHVIRPLEYHYFDDPETIYNTEHTYLKGAAVLHMLRGVLGDKAFFSGLAHYLDKHELSNVESADLKIAIEEATGRNLDWFFDDWVTGGGHPVIEVEARYLEDLKLVDLKVEQVQPLVDGQGLFKLPVAVTIATPSATSTKTLWIEKDSEKFLLPAAEKPLMVSFDGRGDLVAEIRFDGKELDELLYQASHDAVPGRLRAMRQLTRRFPADPKALRQLDELLKSGGFWGLRAEAAKLLGEIRTAGAEGVARRALESPDYRVRKAAVLGLGQFGTPSSREILRAVVRSDAHTDVAATALIALARSDAEMDTALILEQLERDSWWDEIRIASLRALEELAPRQPPPAAELLGPSPPAHETVLGSDGLPGRPELVKIVRPYAGSAWNQDVRRAAFDAWRTASPTDPDLHAALLEAAKAPPYEIQKFALEKLGELYVAEATPMLEEIVELDFDADFTTLAKEALKEIRRISPTAAQ